MSEQEAQREGWGFTAGSRKCHYFTFGVPGLRSSFSLCRKYGLRGAGAPLDPDDGKPSRDDCTPCRRALDKRRAKAQLLDAVAKLEAKNA